MRKVGVAFLLMVCLGIGVAAQTVMLPCHEVVGTTPGSFQLQVLNKTTTAYKGFIIVFAEPVIVAKALAVNEGRGGFEAVDGAGGVWKVTLGKTLLPGTGVLYTTFSTVTPVPVDRCKFIRAIFPLR